MHRALLGFVGAVCVLVCIPAGYLLWVVASGDADALATLGRGDTWWAVLRTLGLGALSAGLCVGLSVPLAWLTHATDLPARRLFRVALNLPLAVPSYVGAFVAETRNRG